MYLGRYAAVPTTGHDTFGTGQRVWEGWGFFIITPNIVNICMHAHMRACSKQPQSSTSSPRSTGPSALQPAPTMSGAAWHARVLAVLTALSLLYTTRQCTAYHLPRPFLDRARDRIGASYGRKKTQSDPPAASTPLPPSPEGATVPRTVTPALTPQSQGARTLLSLTDEGLNLGLAPGSPAIASQILDYPPAPTPNPNPTTPTPIPTPNPTLAFAALMDHIESTVLPEKFGHRTFRSGQREVIQVRGTVRVRVAPQSHRGQSYTYRPFMD